MKDSPQESQKDKGTKEEGSQETEVRRQNGRRRKTEDRRQNRTLPNTF
jgi:hypothetical protein